jgi:hypothetical protein
LMIASIFFIFEELQLKASIRDDTSFVNRFELISALRSKSETSRKFVYDKQRAVLSRLERLRS